MKNPLIFIIVLIISMSMVYAYDNTTLKNYFTMGDGWTTYFYDKHTGLMLTATGMSTSCHFHGAVTGIQGNAGAYWSCGSGEYRNQSITVVNSNTFTVNFWLKINAQVNESTLSIPYSSTETERLIIYSNSTHVTDTWIAKGTYGTYNKYGFSGATPINIPLNTWFMITYQHFPTANVSIWINGVFRENITTNGHNNFVNKFGFMLLDNNRSYIDEVSLWNVTLNSTDLLTLYNSGNGLNYETTMAGGGSTNYTEQPYTFYTNYCYFDVLCSVYNASGEYCIDDWLHWCTFGCADLYIDFDPDWIGVNVTDFQAECYNDTYTITNRVDHPPTTPIYYFDICMANNVLCHNATIVNGTFSCPYTINAIVNQERCVTCEDDQQYWSYLLASPTNFNYTGTCGFCRNDCTEVNSTRCSNANTLTKCTQDPISGCLRMEYFKSCGYGCSNGLCLTKYDNISLNITGGVGHTDINDITLWKNFFNLNVKDSRNQILIALIVIILSGCCGLGIVFALGRATGRGTPAFINVGIVSLLTLLPFIYFVLIGFIPFWVLIILVILCGFIVASMFRNTIIGG